LERDEHSPDPEACGGIECNKLEGVTGVHSNVNEESPYHF
jgi:hypothetical protein